MYHVGHHNYHLVRSMTWAHTGACVHAGQQSRLHAQVPRQAPVCVQLADNCSTVTASNFVTDLFIMALIPTIVIMSNGHTHHEQPVAHLAFDADKHCQSGVRENLSCVGHRFSVWTIVS